MVDDLPVAPKEDARLRFRRLLSSTEEEGAQEAQTASAAGQADGASNVKQTGEAPAANVPLPGVYGQGTAAAPARPLQDAPLQQNNVQPVSTTPAENIQPDTTPIKVKPGEPQPSAVGDEPAAAVAAVNGKTPPRKLPALDRYGFPIPGKVSEADLEATRVSAAAFSQGVRQNQDITRPVLAKASGPAPSAVRPPAKPPRPPKRPAVKRSCTSYLLRGCLVSLFLIILLLLCALSLVFYQYYRIAAALPDINDLQDKASQFETTRILDRNGNNLYEILDPSAGRRTFVRLDKISPYLVAATIATEDKEFYNHPGFDLWAIARAFWQNYRSGGTVSGASTITQQLARTLLFTPEERNERSYDRKIREAILAAEITRRYSKDEILELYLNENNYGNLAYGVEAAAETYFGTRVDKLTLGQAAFLAGLPQAPSVYDVYTNPDITLKRQEDVLVLMYEASQQQGCIYVSNNPQRICIDPVAVTTATDEIRNYRFNPLGITMRYPHWVNYIRSLLETQFDPQTIYRSGFTVYTTLDPGLQELAQNIVRKQVDAMADRHATNGALVAVRPATGEILAMVGSADFYNEAISGQVNMAISPRQPGSSIKPLTYVAAFEKGWTPATLLWDVPTDFPPSGRPDDNRPPYQPVNYDGRYHGPVTVRSALANSYNIPAVKALSFVGIYDDPTTPEEDGFIGLAKRLGIISLTRDDYGLSLTLGGGEVSLLEMTGAYATFANSGRHIPPVAITRILDHNGNVVYDYRQPLGDQVIRPEHAFLITSILADNEARTPAFGPNSVLNLPFPAAVKTGTTNDYRDNLTLGYNPDLAVGVWVGNADYTPMVNTTGLTGAAPIWSEFMQTAVPQASGGSPTPFTRPGGIIEQVICTVSGTQPSQWCPSQRGEIFAADQPPWPKEEDLWQKVNVDTWTGLRASSECPDFTAEQLVLNVTDTWAKKWLKKDPEGQAWLDQNGFQRPVVFIPPRECKSTDPRPVLAFTSPRNRETVVDAVLDLWGVAYATDWFDFFRIDAAVGENPVQWQILDQQKREVTKEEILYTWDLENVPNEVISLRLYMHSIEDTYAEKTIYVRLQVPTPTPTPTPTFTATPTPTATATATPTPTNTPTPTATDTPTNTPTATDTPTPTLDKPPKATEIMTPTP